MRETRLGNKTGNKAGDDAGDETRETGDDSGDGGRAGELLTKRGGRSEPERFLPWAAGRSSGWQRWARCQGPARKQRSSAVELRTGEDAAIEALLSQGRAADAGGSSGCARDELLVDPAASGAGRVATEEVALGALQKKKKSLRRCCAKDERQMLEDPAAARETNEHSD